MRAREKRTSQTRHFINEASASAINRHDAWIKWPRDYLWHHGGLLDRTAPDVLVTFCTINFVDRKIPTRNYHKGAGHQDVWERDYLVTIISAMTVGNNWSCLFIGKEAPKVDCWLYFSPLRIYLTDTHLYPLPVHQEIVEVVVMSCSHQKTVIMNCRWYNLE